MGWAARANKRRAHPLRKAAMNSVVEALRNEDELRAYLESKTAEPKFDIPMASERQRQELLIEQMRASFRMPTKR